MAWYIKSEQFTEATMILSKQERETHLSKHRDWVNKLKAKGIKVFSGYLIDSNRLPGGGGLLMIQAESFKEAERIINKDPMILSGLVDWQLHEWMPIWEESLESITLDMHP